MRPTIMATLAVLLLAFFSCSESEEETKPELNNVEKNAVDLAGYLEIQDGEMKIFTMPAPLQITTILSLNGVDYDDDLVAPPPSETEISTFKEAMSLGMQIVDMGYETVYGHHDKSYEFVASIQQSLGNLHINPPITEGFVARYENNKGNIDSLCVIILETYEAAHGYFERNEREELGLVILTGAYIEGLYIATHASFPPSEFETYNEMMIQQKLFLGNFIQLMGAFNGDPDYDKLLLQLVKIETAMEGIEVVFNEDKDKHLLRRPIMDNVKEELKVAVTQIRDEILSQVE